MAAVRHAEVKGAAPIDPKSKEKIALADTNLANYGSKEHKELKLKVAQTEAAWTGAGAAPGTQIWRVEKFKIVGWPKEKKGSFYDGDAYIVLNTYKKKGADGKLEDKLSYNVHFWLGGHSSQDERGVAAYKTVELDDLLGDVPVQFREVQGHESPEFLDIFGRTIRIMTGGVASGFNIVKPTEYKSRLLHLQRIGTKNVRVDEVPLSSASLNQGDVFVLDAGLKLFQWNGSSASVWEKRKADELMAQIDEERNGRPTKTVLQHDDDNKEFWAALGGKGCIAPAKPEVKVDESKGRVIELHRVDIPTGASRANFVEIVPSGTKLEGKHFETGQTYIVDVEDNGHRTLYVWVGQATTVHHSKLALMFGQDYAQKEGLADDTRIVRVLEGQEPADFKAVLAAAPAKRAAVARPPVDPARALSITVVEGKGLPKLDPEDGTDAYVIVHLSDAKKSRLLTKRTPVAFNTQDPSFNAAFDYSKFIQTPAGRQAATVVFEAFDEDGVRDEFIGTATLRLPETAKTETVTLQLTNSLTKPQERGTLTVSYTWHP